MKTIVGMFENTRDADRAFTDLTQQGFRREDISVLARQDVMKSAKNEGLDVSTSAGVGAVGGSTAGGIAGLLVGIGALAIPGIGPVIAAGTLGTVIGTTALGAGLGAAAGGIVGALTGMGLSHDEANFYAEGVKRGNILVAVKADDNQIQLVSDLLRRANAVDVNTRRQEWQGQGWSHFDEAATTTTTDTTTTTTNPML